MTGDSSQHEALTRRDYMKYGGAVVGGGLLAGCSSQSSTESAPTDTSGAEPTASATGTPAESYEACIEPVGCQTFEEVPETYMVNNGEWADMAFALGQRDGFLTSAYMIPGFLFEPFGLDVPPLSETESLSQTNWDKEIFYEQDPDVILMDPNYMHKTGWDKSWDKSDTNEISENVAPFFGNNILRRRDWHDYKLYSMYEALERLAELFQERERYEALAEVHASVQDEIQSRLPPADERPEIALINSASNPNEGTFYPMRTQDEGVELKPYRDLDIRSAFTADHIEAGTIDYETLLEVDPEILVVHWGISTTGDQDTFSPKAFREQFVTPFEEDPTGSQLTAVQEGNVYPGAFGSQGPLVNLLQTELVAQQLYPEEFGAFDAETFPEVPAEQQLFDRQRVSDIINGDI
ncbi:ABC transporter substrate-binding protein [Halogeometricum borinquense]|uniref:Ferrichrome-binding protein n=2 Tax=Halogeometricum borinquense (strain ATCC 700274 / DSM 11551 / JCM 10706 / KCTC 4070 / PR3) TaxID=469382 RepID=E4NUU3_HALBP|nr:ABC transporter substrate-binding protein [Halogeometricum borinquense]ADQ68813.1 ferrichrome-binding protein [Halogeometricum borinquense DSM 11551]